MRLKYSEYCTVYNMRKDFTTGGDHFVRHCDNYQVNDRDITLKSDLPGTDACTFLIGQCSTLLDNFVL